MSEYLVIRIDQSQPELATWIAVDSTGARHSEPVIGTLQEAATNVAERRVIVLVPSADVLTTTVDIPVKGARLLAALPFALEEFLAEDIEEERRVFHVGITRASDTTTVVCTAGSESRFVSQLDNARDPDAEPEPAVVARSRSAPRPAPKVDPGDPLRESLRKWRAQKAKEDAVPAYVVFNDRTLDDLVLRRPTDLASLGRCHGIGPAKLDRFGDELLGLLEP